MNKLWMDYEVRSCTDLEVHGLDRYLDDPTTEILLGSYGLNDNPIKLWDATGSPLPRDLRDSLLDPSTLKVAWNAAFERGVTKRILKIDVPLSQWNDPMITARYLSMPGKLDDVCRILELPLDQAKLAEGNYLVRLFCLPESMGGEETLFGISPPSFFDRVSRPREWTRFCEYCIRDTEAMRTIYHKTKRFIPPDFEKRLWILSEEINERGIPADLDLAVGAGKIADRAKDILLAEMKTLSGVENPNSPDQILKWAQKQGYPFSKLGKNFVKRALDGEAVELTDLGSKVLTLRQEAAKTASNKLVAIRDIISKDGRVRHQFAFYGASRTGRWSGGSDDEGSGGVQLHNLARPSKEISRNLDKAISLLRAGVYDDVAKEFTSPIEAVGSCIRSIFRAPTGSHFIVADLSGIETRALAWLLGEDKLLQIFRDGRDPYIEFASKVYHIPYADLVDSSGKIKPEHAEKRQICKSAVLGCGYQLSAGDEVNDRDGNRIKTGLLGYSANMGILMTKLQAIDQVEAYRAEYTKVKAGWKGTNNAAITAIRTGKVQTFRHLVFEPLKNLLRVHLPSGRCLHYIRPRIERQSFTYVNHDGEVVDAESDGVTYEGIDSKTHSWSRIKTHGGKWVEQTTQAFSRDILAEGMKRADEAGFEIVLHCHDEIVALVPDSSHLGLKDLIQCMSAPVSWAPDLPLEAAGYVDDVYRKE